MNLMKFAKDKPDIWFVFIAVLLFVFFLINVLYLKYSSDRIASKLDQITEIFLMDSGIIVDCSEVNENK